jgi:hypothetical protein
MRRGFFLTDSGEQSGGDRGRRPIPEPPEAGRAGRLVRLHAAARERRTAQAILAFRVNLSILPKI